jgi:hypothetical protein
VERLATTAGWPGSPFRSPTSCATPSTSGPVPPCSTLSLCVPKTRFAHAARSYSWIKPPRTSLLITDCGGASEVAGGDLGTGAFMSSDEQWVAGTVERAVDQLEGSGMSQWIE